jgi:hypothetical protein
LAGSNSYSFAAIANNSEVAAPEVAANENELLPANVVAVLSWTESDAQTIPLRLADIKTEVRWCCSQILGYFPNKFSSHFELFTATDGAQRSGQHVRILH